MSDSLTYLKLETEDGTWLVDPGEEPRIDAAVESLISSSGMRDSLLSITLLNGEQLRIRASDCNHWFVSTPDGRRKYWEINQALEADEKAAKAEAGIFE